MNWKERLFQTTLGHYNNEILNSFLAPPPRNKYLLSYEIVHKNPNMKQIPFWNCRG